MSKFATDRTFDGQRASLGRIVVVRFVDSEPEAGIVTVITDDDDVYVRGFSSMRAKAVLFASAKTEESCIALPENSWTWPVRV